MRKVLNTRVLVKFLPGVVVALGILMAAETGVCQTPPLLKLQRSRADLNIDAGGKHGQGMWGLTFGNPGDVWKYPNSLSCLVVYKNGNYVLEKRNETTVGRPKIKRAEGTLGADDLERLKSILDDEALKKISSPPMPELPEDAQAVRDIETVEAQIDRAGTEQTFLVVKERVKTGALISATSGPSTGMDAYLDNGTAFRKTLEPLMKWFDGVEKKSKSDMKEEKPQYCTPMNIG